LALGQLFGAARSRLLQVLVQHYRSYRWTLCKATIVPAGQIQQSALYERVSPLGERTAMLGAFNKKLTV
jgi:hypothetical protein